MAIEMRSKEIVTRVEEDIKNEILEIKEQLGFVPILATILVGDNPASVTYVNMKAKACERVGLSSRIIKLPKETSTEQLLEVIDELNNDKYICGILLQHPVPRQIDERLCFDRIAVEKDVDGVNSLSFGRMVMGQEAFASATPLGIIRLLKEYKIPLSGKHAVVVGRSAILGKPVAMLLLNENCTVTICHSKTENLANIVKGADIVVGAVGIPNFIKADWIKEGAVLVDAGYNKGNVGDIDLENAKIKASAYTPVPGGVGPMTINSLMLQTLYSAKKLI
ncbi:MAG: bifunctional 5,10-methylenetetrahydrofolate dehydrogenase/5,10-methenyltetrahydrofolate cyclohydrolase [Christensenellales bacterium]